MRGDNDINKPVVSVCMLTYNHALFIAQALDSILMQQADFEFDIVAGDDCSTDDTRKILLSYQERYPGRVKLLFHEKNIGAMQNHIAVMAACTGKYIAMCEGDDYWTDDRKLQQQINFLSSNPAYSFSCHTVHRLQENTRQLSLWPTAHFKNDTNGRQIKLANFFDPYLVATASVVYRASCIDIEVVKGLKYFKDIFMYALLLSKGDGICFNKSMAVYRIHDKGIWSGQATLPNMLSNALTAIHISLYFQMQVKELNLYAYHQAKSCMYEKIPGELKYRQQLRQVALHLVSTFWRYSGFSKKMAYLNQLIKSYR